MSSLTVNNLRNDMAIVVEPELGVAVPEELPPMDLKERTEAASKTAELLADHGLDIEPTKEDKDIAAKITLAYADDPEATSKGDNQEGCDPDSGLSAAYKQHFAGIWALCGAECDPSSPSCHQQTHR